MERASGVTFHDAQIALARQWVGKDFSRKDVPHEVYIKTPDEDKVSKEEKEKKKIPLPNSIDSAKNAIARFEAGAQDLRMAGAVADSVSHHALQGRRSLLDETWLGSEEEELNWYVDSCAIGG
jgi:phospholipase D1/2